MFHEFTHLLLPILGLNLLLQGNLFFMNAMASYTGESAVSCLLYSYTMAQAPVSLIDLILFSALFPFAARLSCESAYDAFQETFYSVLKGIILFLLPLNLWMVLSRTDLIGIVLQHGRFDAEDTRLTALCFLGHSLAILPWAIEAFAYRCLFALKHPEYYLRIVALRVGCTVTGCLILVPFWGLFGVVLAFAMGLGISALLSCFYVEKILRLHIPARRPRPSPFNYLLHSGIVLMCLVLIYIVVNLLRTACADSPILIRLGVSILPCIMLSLGTVIMWMKSHMRTTS